MTLAELSNAWNALRSSSLGRGVRPLVSPPTANLVAVEHARFRKFLADADPTDDMLTSVTARKWVERYRKVLARVQREGKAPTPDKVLDITPVEASLAVADKLQKSIAWGVVGSGVAIALYVLGTVQRRGRR